MNIFADTKSLVMGNCTNASPAKTISPTLSFSNLSMRRDIIFFDFSRRLGAISSASIEFEMSSAITVSIPCRVTVSIFEPNCGRARTTVISAIATIDRVNFTVGRYAERSGISSLSNAASPYSFNRLIRRWFEII